MWETLAILLGLCAVGLLMLGAGVLAIVKAVKRFERRIDRATRGATRGRGGSRPKPRSGSGGRSAGTGRSRAEPSPPRFRVPPVFAPKPEMRWVGTGQTVRLHELAIESPLVYLAADRRASGEPLDPSEILGGLVVDRRAPAGPAPEWPSYARLEPAQRWGYLAWLADGRSAPPADPAWAMLHLMGLERRALVEGLDLALVVQEVCRVRDLVSGEIARAEAGGDSGAQLAARRWAGYMRQSGALLWALVARQPGAFSERDARVLASRTHSWSEEALAAALAWCVRRGGGVMGPWMAMVAAEHAPGARRSVVLERVPEKFRTLFEARLAERFPAGPALKVAKRERVLSYRPANASVGTVEVAMPDAPGIASQFGPLVEIWNSCIDDLRPLARAGEAAGPMTLARWEAMPADLRAAMDNPFAAGLAALAARHADEGGHAIVPVREVVAVLSMDVGERSSLTPTQSRALAAGVEGAGMGLEPDARLTGSAYALDAEVVLLPRSIPWRNTDEGRSSYAAASCVLRLGAAVAMADGEASEAELGPIAAELERAFDLSEDDHRRLEALTGLLRARGSELRSVSKKLVGALSPEARRGVGALLVAVAAADGVVGAAERTMLRSCAKVLGLDPAEIEAALGAAAGGGGPGVSGAAAAGEPAPLVLDRAAIDRIAEETRQVAALLAEAMRGDVGETADREVATPVAVSAPVVAMAPAIAPAPSAAGDSGGPEGLPARFAAFYTAVVARESWSLDEAGALARGQRLMLAGAVEAVNDWAYERVEGPVLIEEGDRLVVDQDRLRMLG